MMQNRKTVILLSFIDPRFIEVLRGAAPGRKIARETDDDPSQGAGILPWGDGSVKARYFAEAEVRQNVIGIDLGIASC
jgi:hypothetical protein